MGTNNQGLLRTNASTLIIFQRLLDPILVTGLLLVLTAFYGVSFKTDHILLAAITVLLIPPVFKAAGLYHSYRGVTLTAEIPRIFLAWGIIDTILLFLGYTTKTSEIFSRSVLLSWAVSVPVVLCITHISVRLVLRQFRASGRNSRSAVIAGVREVSCHLAEQLGEDPYLGIELHGFFDNCSSVNPKKLQGKPLLGTLDDLPEYVRQHRIDVVYVSLTMENEATVASLMGGLKDTTACVYFVPNIFLFNLMQARAHEINGIPLLAVWEIPFSDLQSLAKRAIDIAVASLALICLAPVMIPIAIGVKLSSPGPILFKQRRYGLNGREIIVYKFRSMKVMEDGDTVQQAKRNDDRITKIGAFLRRTSLDELPQFINVLQGRMSIVGPRPHAVAHNEQYRKLISGYMLRHKVKPGITGWAQIHGFRGETDTLDKMQKRIEYDLQYLKNWSLGLDLKIIFRTALVFFHSHNAY